jgi:hypothetical protein
VSPLLEGIELLPPWYRLGQICHFPQEPHNYQLVDILTYRPFTSKPHGPWTHVTLVMMMMMQIMITIMSMGWDYVSVLPPTYLLFIHYVIYERGESWWIDYCKGVILTRSPELTEILSTVSWAKGMTIWPWEVFLFILASNFVHVKCYDSGPPASLPLRRKLCCGFLSPLTLWRRSLSKCYLRIQSVPQREHHTSPLQRSTGWRCLRK